MSKLKRFLAYWRESVAQCQEVHDMIIYVVFILSVGVALAAELAGFKIPGLEFFSDPLTQKISIFIAILTFVWILIWLPFRRHQAESNKHAEQIEKLIEKQKPKFKLSCRKDINGCAIENPDGSMKFFRLQVETDCVNGIKECKGHLIKIEKDGVTVYDHDAIELPFARAHEPDCLAKTISPNVPYFLDVLVTYNPVHVVNFATKGHSPATNEKREYIFANKGEYILTVSVSGKDVPTVSAKLKFVWKGQWFTATIEKIK